VGTILTWTLAAVLGLSGIPVLDPLEASHYVDQRFPELDGFIVDLCLVESGGCRRAKGVHHRDGKWGRLAYAKANRSGRLSQDCAFHREPYDASEQWWAAWSTVGNHGLMTAHNLHRLSDCLPQETFELPILSAFAAAHKAKAFCAMLGRRFPDVPCTHKWLRCHWAGTAKPCDWVWDRWQRAIDKHYSWQPTWERLVALERPQD